jgi:2'-5' RNA ligase
MNYKLTMTETAGITDMSFDEYNSRQLYEISAERNRERALNAKPAGNFIYNGEFWSPQKYEGFAVISMLNENVENEALNARLIEIQKELQYNLQPAYAFYRLPSESFHQTVANTLSAERFKQHIVEAGLEEAYPAIISNAFDEIPAIENEEPIRMKMAGLSIFGTAIGILGIFENEEDYERIIRFRSGFYGDDQLAQLNVKMTRPFIGHITLAYIEHFLNKNQKDHLAVVISEINEVLGSEENYFTIADTGLRRYHHLAEFIKKDNYPTHLL